MIIKDRVFFVVEEDEYGYWDYVLDSQLKPIVYTDFEQLKEYLYKFKTRTDRVLGFVFYEVSPLPPYKINEIDKLDM